MNKNTAEGAVKEIGGKVRAAVDHAVGDTKGEMQGRIDQASGNAQKNLGKAQDALKDAKKA